MAPPPPSHNTLRQSFIYQSETPNIRPNNEETKCNLHYTLKRLAAIAVSVAITVSVGRLGRPYGRRGVIGFAAGAWGVTTILERRYGYWNAEKCIECLQSTSEVSEFGRAVRRIYKEELQKHAEMTIPLTT